MYNKNREGGFTFIELMIVVAIVGVLSVLAIPQYMNHIALSKTTSAVVELHTLRTKVILHVQQNEELPNTAAEVELDETEVGDYWQNPSISNGTVSVEFSNIDGSLNGETLSMVPTFADGVITSWTCTSSASNKSKLPRDCRS